MEKTAFEIGVEDAIEKIALSPETVLRAMAKKSGEAFKKGSGGINPLSLRASIPTKRVREGMKAQQELMKSEKGKLYIRGLARALQAHGSPGTMGVIRESFKGAKRVK